MEAFSTVLNVIYITQFNTIAVDKIVIYEIIKGYMEQKYYFRLYASEIKENLGLLMYDVSNVLEELKKSGNNQHWRKISVKDALKCFMINTENKKT